MAKTAEKSGKKEKALKAFRELSSADRLDVVGEAIQALSDEEREDLIDYMAAKESLKGPSRPFEEYLTEQEMKRKKKAGK